MVLSSYHVFGQKSCVSSSKQTFVYVGVPNSISIFVKGYTCESLFVTVDNGIVKKSNQSCIYDVIPSAVGNVHFSFVSKSSKKQVGQAELSAKKLPKPVAMVAFKNGGAISKGEFSNQVGISAVLQNFDFDVKYSIERFTIIDIRSGKVVFIDSCKSTKFSNELRDRLKRMIEKDDKVIFCNILCNSPDSTISLNPIEFNIVD